MIDAYFLEIKQTLDLYSTTHWIVETQVNYESRSSEQGYLSGQLIFCDNSELHFKEYLNTTFEDSVEKLMYAYHYQDELHQLIFRYDNAQHKPALPKPEHKHTKTEIKPSYAPELEDVLSEIIDYLSHNS